MDWKDILVHTCMYGASGIQQVLEHVQTLIDW